MGKEKWLAKRNPFYMYHCQCNRLWYGMVDFVKRPVQYWDTDCDGSWMDAGLRGCVTVIDLDFGYLYGTGRIDWRDQKKTGI